MRKFRYLLGTCIVGIVALTTSAFAYFNFSSNSSTDTNANATDGDYVNNIKFDNTTIDDTDRYYTLYFFASPYYATGLDTDDISSGYSKSLTDPLDIVKSSNNPYNDTNIDYCITTRDSLDEDETDYSNYSYTQDGNTVYKYISYNKDDNTTYKKADFTGTIYGLDSTTGVYDEYSGDHTYIKLIVNGGLKADTLSKIVVETAFKNKYGFGPGFMGWTYDKKACFNRITTNNNGVYSRYKSNTDYCNVTINDNNITIDETSNNVDQIGNFGNNSDIKLLSADDSLYHINSEAIDGSSAYDNVIYLYPVFGDVAATVDVPILKMLTNPDTDPTSSTYYKTHEIGEVNYNYTDNDGRFSTYLNYNGNNPQTTGPNYTLKNFHVDQSKENDGTTFTNNYQLEVLLINSTTDSSGTTTKSYATSFEKMFDNTQLKTLFTSDSDSYFQAYVNSYIGYFDVDIWLIQGELSSITIPNPEYYINSPKIITSLYDTLGITFAIGLKRDNSLKLVGLQTVNNVPTIDYGSGRNFVYKSSHTYTDDGSDWCFFTSNPITLNSGDILTPMIENGIEIYENISIGNMKYGNMTTNILGNYNNYLASTDSLNKVSYIAADKKGDLLASSANFTGIYHDSNANQVEKTLTDLPEITCKSSGTYEILVSVRYSNGFPKNIQVAYRQISVSCNVLILNSKPSATYSINSENFYSYTAVYNDYKTNNGILAECIFSKDIQIGENTKFSDNITIKSLSQYKNNDLIDLATGKSIKSLIKSTNFYVSRSMILYFSDTSTSS